MAEFDYYKAPSTPPPRLRNDWLARRVARDAERHDLLPRGIKVLVAVSGGRDSMVLLRLLAGLGYWRLTAAHCNFRLRGEASDGDEAFTRAACAALGIDLHIARFETSSWCAAQGVGTEEGARALRYAWFDELCQTYGYDRVAVAHHANDQAETMLLNAARGAGLRGLRGMPRKNGRIVRPLLRIPRLDIDHWIAEQGMEYREDTSNGEDMYARNVLRHSAVPALVSINRRAIEHMARASDAAEEARATLLEESESQWGDALRPLAAGGETISTNDSTAMQHKQLLRFWLRERMDSLGFTPQQATSALRWLDAPSVGRRMVAGNVAIRAERDGIWLGPAQPEAKPPERYERTDEEGLLTIREEPCGPFSTRSALRAYANRGAYSATLDAEKLHYPLTVRRWHAGDRIRPLGMKGSKLVSDVLTDARIAGHTKEEIMVVESGGKIAWIVGARVSSEFALHQESARAAILRWKGES